MSYDLNSHSCGCTLALFPDILNHFYTRLHEYERVATLQLAVYERNRRGSLAGNCKVHVNCLAYFVNSAVSRSNRNLSESQRITRNKKVSRWISSWALFSSEREENKRESFARIARLHVTVYKNVRANFLSCKARGAISKRVVISAIFPYDSLIFESSSFLKARTKYTFE